MTLLEKLATIGKPPIRSLESGNVTSIEEFWNKVVSPVLPRKETVLAWHELLMAYVKSEHPCLAIRGYNSFPPERYCDLRRGFFTNAEEFSFFHTDNYFAAYFQKMVLDDFVPTLEEFSLAFDQRKFPSRFGQITTEEKALLAIPLGKDPRINVGGFKLAHIIPVGKEYCYDGKIMGIHDMLVTYFPMGKRSDWTKQHDGWGEFYARDFVPDERAIKYAQAHFLRFVHPFNITSFALKRNARAMKNAKRSQNISPCLTMHMIICYKLMEVHI